MAMIECSHLTMGYGSQIAVEDLSFSVEEGDYLCIVGPNGSGKSTLIKGLLGLAQPKSGSISYREDSGSACCSPAPSAPRTGCSCSTNRPPLSTPGLRPSFTI